MGTGGRLERYRGKSAPARRLRRRLRLATRERTVKILAAVLGAASVLSLLPGSVQQDLQLGLCKGLTLGVGRCRPVDLDLPALPLPPARCPGLGAVADAFPLLVSGSRRLFGDLDFERVATSDGAVHWIPSAGRDVATGNETAVLAGATQRLETGSTPLHVPLDASWTFATAERERSFARSVLAATSHVTALRQLASLAARFAPTGPVTQLSQPTQRQATAEGLPTIPSPLVIPSLAGAPRTESGSVAASSSTTPTVSTDPARATVSVDEVTGAATTTVPLVADPPRALPLAARAPAAAGAALETSSPPAGMLQIDDDTNGRVSRVRVVLVQRHQGRLTLTFVDVSSESDADAAALDSWASGTYGSHWARADLAPQSAPDPSAPPWKQIFWAGATAVRVTLAPAAPAAPDGAQAALASWPRGYLGAGLWSGSLVDVHELQPVVGASRVWLPQSGCALAQVQATPAAPGPAETAVTVPVAADTPRVLLTRLAPVRLAFVSPTCTAEPPSGGWEQEYRCDAAGGATGSSGPYQVFLSSRVSALDDPALLGAALLDARRTGSWPGASVTGDVAESWLGAQPSNRLSFRAGGAGAGAPRSYGVLVTGTVPGGGSGALLVTSRSQLDPSTVEQSVAAVSVQHSARR